MKKNVIIRKIDELGRVVIPMDIRKNLNLNWTDSISMKIRDNQLIIEKYDELSEYEQVMCNVCKCLEKFLGGKLYLVNKNSFLYGANDLISTDIMDILNRRRDYISKKEKCLLEKVGYYSVLPIIVSSDVMGGLIYFSENEVSYLENNYLLFAREFIVSFFN